MNISRFFIDRPIFATVLSIVIVIVGAVAYGTLPVAQYPEVVPPTVVVNASYPGANAQVVCATVATPLEQEINGVEDMLYISSQCTSDGSLSTTITFKLGTDLDIAQVLVQNRVAIAEPTLPGGGPADRCHHAEPADLLASTWLASGRTTSSTSATTRSLQVRDVLSRVDGVGDVTPFGARDYSMRV
jgi:HAE1 family hydrophobic/amphiphilic exporter-1